MTVVHDRRAAASRVEISDGNGEKIELYTFSILKWKTWLGAIAALFAIAGIVFGAAAAGVRIGTRDELQYQMKEPLSPLNLHIGTMVDHAMDVREQAETPLHRQQNADIASLKEGICKPILLRCNETSRNSCGGCGRWCGVSICAATTFGIIRTERQLSCLLMSMIN